LDIHFSGAVKITGAEGKGNSFSGTEPGHCPNFSKDFRQRLSYDVVNQNAVIFFHRSRGRLRSTRIGGSEVSNSVSPQQDFEKMQNAKRQLRKIEIPV
jgi:hypothetical protein